MPIADFNSKYLTPLLEKLNREDKFCFLMGDFNINLMKINSESDNSQFYKTMCSYFFTPIVFQPTKVTDKSKTLIDNIFFNSFEFTTLSGNITHSISDHLIQFVILEDFITPKPLPKTNLYKRNFDKVDNNKLKEDLHKIDWINEILKNGNDINEIFDIFYKTLSEIVDRHAPLTKVTKKERTLQSKPWINKEIKHLMWKRGKFFRKYCKKLKNETQKKLIHDKFKKLRNSVTFSVRKSKNEYFKLFFDKKS